ncbi:hypothetical protein Scep_003571 [Stephania cephalantha]|uniref:Uncharacterized protein n=1 Tax=Stephania cephalantha TaxID=152367 RepID=A0AAP0PUI3_9MAGN
MASLSRLCSHSRFFTAAAARAHILHRHRHLPSSPRLLSTLRRPPPRPRPRTVDIGARARQLQNRRLWTYAVSFSCVAGFIVVVLSSFEEQLVFYITPTEALDKFTQNPNKSRFRLGGLVLEGSVAQPASSPFMEFVVTDLITDILVRYQGPLPDLFREGHSVVVEGFVRPLEDPDKEAAAAVTEKARGIGCFFSATEVLAKHDEKYMPAEVAKAIDANKKKIAAAASAAEAQDEERERNQRS